MRLKDKVAVVTGASGGLGAGICGAFASEGADCVVVYRSDRAEAEKTAAKVAGLGRRAEVVRTDVSDEAQVKKLFATTHDRFGRIWIFWSPTRGSESPDPCSIPPSTISSESFAPI